MKLYHLWQTLVDESSLFLPFAEHQIFCNICRLNFPFVAQKMCAQAKLQSQPNFQISCIQTILVTYILTLWSIQRPMIWNFNLIPKIRPFWNRSQMHCPTKRKFLERRPSGNVFCDMGGSFGEIMELPKQLLYLRAQLGFMEARKANHAEKDRHL